MRDINRAAVLRLIGRAGPIARGDIAATLRLSPATVTHVVRELLESGLVRPVSTEPSGGGRPRTLLALVGGAASALGVKVAADHLVAVRANLEAEVLERFSVPFEATAPDAVDRIAALLEPLVESDGSPPLLGIGVGVPGIVSEGARGVVTSPMLGWHQLALGEELARRLSVPVLIENDVNTLAVAERLSGRGAGVEDFITLTLGRGIGLGIVVRGELYRGARGGAGEFGHVTIDPDGPPCFCGKRGCLEALVADAALVAEAVEAGLLGAGAGAAELLQLAADGNAGAAAIYARAGTRLGHAVAGLVTVLDPALILVSGEGSRAWPHVAASFQEAVRERAFAPLRDVAVEVDPWDDARWAQGAAALVVRAPFAAPLDEHGSDQPVRARLRGKVEAA
jgi:predicted NBD/HSP70 family sugar kinase